MTNSSGKSPGLQQAFGLLVRANARIPSIEPAAPGLPDVRIHFRRLPEVRGCTASLIDFPSDISAVSAWQLSSGCYRLLYADGTEFFIDAAGTQIWCHWPSPLTLEDTATYLLGPVFGFVLRLRGTVCLHASSICIDNEAVALVGPPGAGKSTMAAAFAVAGFPVLADDVAALAPTEREVLIRPAYPRIRLWPEAAHLLFGAADAIPLLTPNWDKRYLDLSNGAFQRTPLPLSAIYILASDEHGTNAVEDVPAREALIKLVANGYTFYLLDQSMRVRELEVLGRVASSIPVRQIRLRRRSPVEECRAIVEHYRRSAAVSRGL